jgi:hypothetical protein
MQKVVGSNPISRFFANALHMPFKPGLPILASGRKCPTRVSESGSTAEADAMTLLWDPTAHGWLASRFGRSPSLEQGEISEDAFLQLHRRLEYGPLVLSFVVSGFLAFVIQLGGPRRPRSLAGCGSGAAGPLYRPNRPIRIHGRKGHQRNRRPEREFCEPIPGHQLPRGLLRLLVWRGLCARWNCVRPSNLLGRNFALDWHSAAMEPHVGNARPW